MNDLGTYALQICTSKIQEERRHPNHVHGYKYVFKHRARKSNYIFPILIMACKVIKYE